jgi:hypothetical protein
MKINSIVSLTRLIMHQAVSMDYIESVGATHATSHDDRMGERTVELTGLYGHHQALSVDEVPGDMSNMYAYTSTPDAHIYRNLGPSNQPASRSSEPAIHSRPTPIGYTSLRRDPLPSDGISLGKGVDVDE